MHGGEEADGGIMAVNFITNHCGLSSPPISLSVILFICISSALPGGGGPGTLVSAGSRYCWSRLGDSMAVGLATRQQSAPPNPKPTCSLQRLETLIQIIGVFSKIDYYEKGILKNQIKSYTVLAFIPFLVM